MSDFHPMHGKDHVSINDSPHVTDFPKNPLGLLEARGKSICYTSWIYLVFRNIPNVDLLSTPKYFQKNTFRTVSVLHIDIFHNKIICTTQKGQLPKLDQNVTPKKQT